VGTNGRVDELLSFDAGYLGWTVEGAEGYPVTWQSADGVAWVRSELTKPISPCPGWVPRPDGEVEWGATNGREVVLVGLEYFPHASVCGVWRAAAWVSSDGRSWQRSPGFAGNGTDNQWAYGVWPVPGGWEAGVSDTGGILSIWRSADGLRWEDTGAEIRLDEQYSYNSFASSPDGTRAILAYGGENELHHLFVSHDGRTWADAPDLPRDAGFVSPVVAPGRAFPDWILVATDENAEKSTLLFSPDLARWRTVPFPVPGVVSEIRHTPFGLVALLVDPCLDTGGECAVEPPRYLLSTDGHTWTDLLATTGVEQFVDGPAGVLGGGPVLDDGPQPIMRLEPYSKDEAFLLAGLRSDARIECAPRRTGLPPKAVAAVECSPVDPVVDQIGVFLFASQQDMLDAYFARLAANGVQPRSGTCPNGPGEYSYYPGDEGPTFAGSRHGCFLNEFGIANYRFTVAGSLVYVGILGQDRDVSALTDWAWAGNEDVPGAPTAWSALGG
jgi:hypothetical protein